MSYSDQYYTTDPNRYQEYASASYTYDDPPPGEYTCDSYEMAPQRSGSSIDSSNSGYANTYRGSSSPSYSAAVSQYDYEVRSDYDPTGYYSTSPVSPTSYAYGQIAEQMEIPKSKPRQIYPCLYPDCDTKANFKRLADLERHMKTVHYPEPFDCPHRWCGRVGDNGFTRKDHLTDHLREVHVQNIPKATRSGQKSKGSQKE